MKALYFIGLFFSAFLIIMGVLSRKNSGYALSNAVIAGGVLIAVFILIIFILNYVKQRKEK